MPRRHVGELTDYPEKLLRPLRSLPDPGELCLVAVKGDLERISGRKLERFPERVLCLPLFGGPWFVSGLVALCYEEGQLRTLVLPRLWQPVTRCMPGIYLSRKCWNEGGILAVGTDLIEVLQHAVRCQLRGVPWFSAWAPVSDFYHVYGAATVVDHRYVLTYGRNAKTAACAAMLGCGRSVCDKLPSNRPPHLPVGVPWYSGTNLIELKIACRLLRLHLPLWKRRQLADELPEDLVGLRKFLVPGDPGTKRSERAIYAGTRPRLLASGTSEELAPFALDVKAVYRTGVDWVQIESGQTLLYIEAKVWRRKPVSTVAKLLGTACSPTADRKFKDTAANLYRHAPRKTFGYDGEAVHLPSGILHRGPEYVSLGQVKGSLRFPPLVFPPKLAVFDRRVPRFVLRLALAAALSATGLRVQLPIPCDDRQWRSVRKLLLTWHCRPANRPYDVPYLHVGRSDVVSCVWQERTTDRSEVKIYRPDGWAGLVEHVLWSLMDRSLPAFPQTIDQAISYLDFLRRTP